MSDLIIIDAIKDYQRAFLYGEHVSGVIIEVPPEPAVRYVFVREDNGRTICEAPDGVEGDEAAIAWFKATWPHYLKENRGPGVEMRVYGEDAQPATPAPGTPAGAKE